MEVIYTEYAVEIYNDGNFVEQLDIFGTMVEAENFITNCNEPLYDGEYLNISIISYDSQGNEIELLTF